MHAPSWNLWKYSIAVCLCGDRTCLLLRRFCVRIDWARAAGSLDNHLHLTLQGAFCRVAGHINTRRVAYIAFQGTGEAERISCHLPRPRAARNVPSRLPFILAE